MISTPSSGIPSDTKSLSLCTRDTRQTSSPSSFSLTRATGSWSRGPRTLRCTSTTWRRRRPSTCSLSTPTASNASPRLPCGPTSSGARQRTGSFGESVVCLPRGSFDHQGAECTPITPTSAQAECSVVFCVDHGEDTRAEKYHTHKLLSVEHV